MALNIDQLKQDLCRQSAIIDLIERSQAKARAIAGCNFYPLFGRSNEYSEALAWQNKVTERLYKYLERLLCKV